MEKNNEKKYRFNCIITAENTQQLCIMLQKYFPKIELSIKPVALQKIEFGSLKEFQNWQGDEVLERLDIYCSDEDNEEKKGHLVFDARLNNELGDTYPIVSVNYTFNDEAEFGNFEYEIDQCLDIFENHDIKDSLPPKTTNIIFYIICFAVLIGIAIFIMPPILDRQKTFLMTLFFIAVVGAPILLTIISVIYYKRKYQELKPKLVFCFSSGKPRYEELKARDEKLGPKIIISIFTIIIVSLILFLLFMLVYVW